VRKRRIVMTQTDPETTRGDQFQGDREEFQVASGDMVDTVKSLIHEGNVRRIIIKHEGYNILEIPLTVALIGTLLVPWLAAVGAISGVITHCTLEVVRTELPETPPVA
jgi:hypothetical protein